MLDTKYREEIDGSRRNVAFPWMHRSRLGLGGIAAAATAAGNGGATAGNVHRAAYIRKQRDHRSGLYRPWRGHHRKQVNLHDEEDREDAEVTGRHGLDQQ
ncbi:Os01g0800200 [Oryza sativa Japonica Group]|jgi:hypothetical protein|uniref:Os01g0800200 protein n=2 Tax=Oryza sativa subsp. japonica TaxID=39947 RepID=C7IXG7_ORYSJ|nr:hypothetical protein EE612_006298 [Oryza sativa]BAH91335.1 Os01g0800233 [Oryza sativa Japonica Group]BAS74788.1 Os01g0800200 [Oryza sativa Japonica Group]|eukprot:NP_001172605.1 Os01g0800233 [Oryza sativa Japonica Group]